MENAVPIQANTRNLAVLAAILAALVLATVITVRPKNNIAPPSQTQLIELEMVLTSGKSPAVRAESARQLGEIATAGLNQPGLVSVQDLNAKLQAALEKESDPTARAAIQSALSNIHKNEILGGALSPLKQNFK